VKVSRISPVAYSGPSDITATVATTTSARYVPLSATFVASNPSGTGSVWYAHRVPVVTARPSMHSAVSARHR